MYILHANIRNNLNKILGVLNEYYCVKKMTVSRLKKDIHRVLYNNEVLLKRYINREISLTFKIRDIICEDLEKERGYLKDFFTELKQKVKNNSIVEEVSEKNIYDSIYRDLDRLLSDVSKIYQKTDKFLTDLRIIRDTQRSLYNIDGVKLDKRIKLISG